MKHLTGWKRAGAENFLAEPGACLWVLCGVGAGEWAPEKEATEGQGPRSPGGLTWTRGPGSCRLVHLASDFPETQAHLGQPCSLPTPLPRPGSQHGAVSAQHGTEGLWLWELVVAASP